MGKFAATLTIDGKAIQFTSPARASTPTAETDGVTSAGCGGFNLRGYSSHKPGLHTIVANVTDETGSAPPASATFTVVSPDRAGKGKVRNVIILLGDGMGIAHRTAARLVRFGTTAGDPNGFLAMDGFPGTGNPATHGVVDDYHAPDQPMLDEMTDAALRVLSANKRGFFLMVEGAHIDKQSHLMDAERAVGEVIEFDRAVGVARHWADKLGRTIVIVVADHECAGFSIIGALQGGVGNLQSLSSDQAITDPDVQPARQKAVGVYESPGFPKYDILSDGYPASYDVDWKILFGYGANGDRYETWLTKAHPVIDSLLSNDIKAELGTAGYAGEPVQRAAVGLKEDQSGLFIRGQAAGKEQAVHTASDVPISAYSSGSDAWRKFVGVQKNTDVFFKLMEAVAGND